LSCRFGLNFQKEDHLNAMGYSDRKEERILEVLGRGLLTEFPDPTRTGCPSSDVLKRIASHEMPLSEAEKWLDHLGSCSPCYREYCEVRNANSKLRRWALFAVAAGILLCVLLVGRILFPRLNELPSAQTAVLDLRNQSITRGAGQPPAQAPLKASRYASHWDIQLPLGSPDGPYEVRLTTAKGEQVYAARGVATITGGITLLSVEVRLSSANPGLYLLQLRKPTLLWNSYPMVVD
jgi:hypothetical protein